LLYCIHRNINQVIPECERALPLRYRQTTYVLLLGYNLHLSDQNLFILTTLKASENYSELLEWTGSETPKVDLRVATIEEAADRRHHAETHVLHWLKTILVDRPRTETKVELDFFTMETILAVHCVQTHGYQLEEDVILRFCEQMHEQYRSLVSNPFDSF
jgi:hypothetical protein